MATPVNRWTPEGLALYICAEDPTYIFKGSRKIKERFQLKMDIHAICALTREPAFHETFLKEMRKKIADSDKLDEMFDAYIYHMWLCGMKSDNPGAKIADILGAMTGKYDSSNKNDVTVMNITKDVQERLNKDAYDAVQNRLKREGGKKNGNKTK